MDIKTWYFGRTAPQEVEVSFLLSYGADWAVLHLTDAGNATLEAEIAQLKAEVAASSAETARLSKIVNAVRAAVA